MVFNKQFRKKMPQSPVYIYSMLSFQTFVAHNVEKIDHGDAKHACEWLTTATKGWLTDFYIIYNSSVQNCHNQFCLLTYSQLSCQHL